jgi:2'-5' RNA ligase
MWSRMRLFIASGFSAPFIEQVKEIQAFAEARLEGAVKWVEPQNIHLTYAFLGSVPEDRIPAIKRSLEEAAGIFKKFEVALDVLGAFPSFERSRVLWLGLKEESPGTLNDLALKIYEALLAEGFILEHKFAAHITIGRVRAGLNYAAIEEIRRAAAGEEVRSPLTSVNLMESRLSNSGPEYEILASRELL